MFKDSVRPIADAGLVSFVEPGSALTPDLPIPSSWSRRRSPATFSGPGEPERRCVRNALRPPQSGDDGSTDFLDGQEERCNVR
ncbi:hypothetical protein [Streptomyces mirabilis]|uniref:hypothetical protein n=1 Tax=Streptomyces mirabilis TaxID=68239 RepID=UPI0036D1831D